MQLKRLFTDEDAVTPVIGIILLVAITVILAAVIGTFVLGLGNNVQDSAPQANFQFEYSGSWDGTASGSMTVTHTGGEHVDAANLELQVGGTTVVDGGTDTGLAGDLSIGTTNDWHDGTDPLRVTTGSALDIDNDGTTDREGDVVRVVWRAPSGETSSTIGRSSIVPN